MQTQERRERKGTKTEGRGARTRCTVGLMVAYASQTWSGEEHVSVMVQRRLRQCTSLRSAQPAATSYMRMRRSCWNAAARMGARSGPRAARKRGTCGRRRRARRARRLAHADMRAAAQASREHGMRSTPLRACWRAGSAPMHELEPEHTQGLQIITKRAGHAACAQGTCWTTRGPQRPPRAGWARTARVRQGGSGAAGQGSGGARTRPRGG